MPAIPLSSSLSSDTRVLDARQVARSISTTASQLLRRIPRLHARQYGDVVAIPTVYAGLNAGPSPGAVVGIVLGSVAGFLLLLWLLWVLSNNTGFIRTSQYEEEDVVVRHRSRSPRSRRSSRRTEVIERSPRRERVIRQERIVRDVHPPREPSRIRETVIVDDVRPERRVEGDDIVEVIEEHSSVGGAPPRRKNRRSSGYR